MARRRPQLSRQAAILGLGVLLALGAARSVRAQGFTPDPFNGVGEYNNAYRDYLTPTYPSGYGVAPNQGLLSGQSGVSRANQFQSYLDELEGGERSSAEHDVLSNRGGGGPGVPYLRANRRFDTLSGRTPAPNPYETLDRAYLRDRQSRDQKYFEYLREPDPKKRAQLYREYAQDKLRAARDLSRPFVGMARTAPGTTAAPPASRTSTDTARPSLSSPSTVAPTNPRANVPSPGRALNAPSPYRRPTATPPPGGRTSIPAASPAPAANRAPRAATGTAPSPTSGPRRLTPSESLRRYERFDGAGRSSSSPTPPAR